MVAEGLLAKLEGCLRDSEALAEELASAAQAERTPEADAAAREGAAQVARVRERLEGVCKAVERADEALAKARLADVEVLRVLRNHLPDGVAGKWKDGVDVPRPDRRILLGEPGSEEQREIAGAIDDPDVARPPPGWEDDPDFFVDDEENQDPVPGVPDVHDPARPQWPGVEWSDDAGVDDQATTTPARLVGLDLADSGLHLLPSQIGMLDAVDDLGDAESDHEAEAGPAPDEDRVQQRQTRDPVEPVRTGRALLHQLQFGRAGRSRGPVVGATPETPRSN